MYQVRCYLYSPLEAKHRGFGDTFYIDEVFAGAPDQKINGKQHYLWRAVDQDGEVVDVFLQSNRDGAAEKRFFKRLLRSHGGEPRKIVTDKLRRYGVAYRNLRISAFAEWGRAVARFQMVGSLRSAKGKLPIPSKPNFEPGPNPRNGPYCLVITTK